MGIEMGDTETNVCYKSGRKVVFQFNNSVNTNIQVSEISYNGSPLSLQNSDHETIGKALLKELVQMYGDDSLSNLTLEGQKRYFYEKNHKGFIAYVVVLNIAVCIGNPICDISNYLQVVNSFKLFCKEKKYKICFCSINEEFVELLRNNGFAISKYGEEALLDLKTYTLSGGKKEKLRQKIRRAEKSGVSTMEYVPTLNRDSALEEIIHRLSEEWLRQKNGHLTFALGEIDFENPRDKRFFIAFDEAGDVVAILIFLPFCGQDGYFLDVMRRKSDSIPGVMEKVIIDATMKMKKEGRGWISLGIAPLARIDCENRQTTLLEKLFRIAYYNANSLYGFQSLYQFKKKFDPCCWNIRYVAQEKGVSSLKIAYAMAKARNSCGIIKLLCNVCKKWASRCRYGY